MRRSARAIARARVDPASPRPSPASTPVGAFHDRGDRGGRGKARDHRVASLRELARARGPAAPASSKRGCARRLDVVHRRLESRAHEVHWRAGRRDCRARRTRSSRLVDRAVDGREVELVAVVRVARARRPRRARPRGRAPSGGITWPSSHASGVRRSSAWKPPQSRMPSRIRKFGRAGGELDVRGADDGPAVEVRRDLRVVRLGHARRSSSPRAGRRRGRGSAAGSTPRRSRARGRTRTSSSAARRSRSGSTSPRATRGHLLGRLGRRRLLEPERVVRLEPPREPDRAGRRELAVRPERAGRSGRRPPRARRARSARSAPAPRDTAGADRGSSSGRPDRT